jgi:peptidoglycan/xylan/chitin deacetylase (PgdA/CDA1 family)
MIPGARNEKDMDGARSARLLFVHELTAGAVHYSELDTPQVRAATRVTGVPMRPIRIAQQLRYKRGRLGFERDVVEPLVAARQAVLGERAFGPPHFLVRVDEFPHYRAWDDPQRFGTQRFERFHEILAGAGVPYLLAVLPRVSREPLSPSGSLSRPLEEGETAMLARLAGEGVSFGLHGLTHRTRFASPRRHSELCGLSPAATAGLLDAGLAELAALGIHPRVFVPPYNRFDAAQLDPLARRFEVVCGGPESIGQIGFQRPPQWRGGTVYLPSYAPFYGRASEILPAVQRAVEAATGLWIPIVLHWGWEAEAGWSELERLAGALAPYAVGWEGFLAAVDRSRIEHQGDLPVPSPEPSTASGQRRGTGAKPAPTTKHEHGVRP